MTGLIWNVIGVFFAIMMAVTAIPGLRRRLLSRPLFLILRKQMPPVSKTEREALEAGNTWWDAQLFTGKPDWSLLQDLPVARLSDAEKKFIDGPVEILCGMLNDWEVTHDRFDLPTEVWDYVKQNQFFGMIIPKQYGGLAFSEFAHSQAVMKIASRCTTAAVTVMVPNSLGPAKLLLAYGTDAQKQYYLPRLARGEEIPAFALTGPEAGSDAGAMRDTGVVCYGIHEGREKVLGIRLNWEKRYITLGPVATVLGLAFKLYDPEHLLGNIEDIGITLALVPTDTAGVSIGKRHYPLDSAFQNGPNWGKDVFIPIDWVIGGREQVGNGWKMLMQCLATGRAISLPALSVGAAKFICRNTGAYARIRTQFKLPIGAFEGIEEVLARMAGLTYLMDAARHVTCAALDDGQRPAVISAIVKYHLTENMRRVINDGMDIQGGSGICLGPLNYIGRLYQVIPVGITVEGANILTRSMIIFGQGAVRCHPFVQAEMQTLIEADEQNAIVEFDQLWVKHVQFFIRNLGRASWLGFSRACFVKTPGDKVTKPYYRQLAKLTSSFAVAADFALLILGGKLKRKERISAYFGDVLSYLYLCSCVLKHFENQGAQEEDSALLAWACQYSLWQAEEALWKALALLPARVPATILRSLLFSTGRTCTAPDEHLISVLAKILLNDNSTRERLTAGIYIDQRPDDSSGRIEVAFKVVLQAAPIEIKLREARRQGKLTEQDWPLMVREALQKGLITEKESDIIQAAEVARSKAIAVDDFMPEQLVRRSNFA